MTTLQFVEIAPPEGCAEVCISPLPMLWPYGLNPNPTIYKEISLEPPEDDKYVVIRRTDYEARLKAGLPPLDKHIVRDAVVIRRCDLAAPHILEAYSNFYLAIAEMLDAVTKGGQPALFDQVTINDNIKQAKRVADYFHWQAVASYDTNRKMPS